ncbi:MAG: type IV toxin-antitoxin system AbiEi family antitoxin domain-containing protein [Acidobacteria bacterium]|nr:type IV toxin-antitoxin system AbiEi family antitoxin domain-containing protein [Acidobacteriota bacterium]
MDKTDAVMMELSRRHLGVLARRQLLDAGIDESAIRRRVASGELQPAYPGVYWHGAAPRSQHGRVLAAVLAVGDHALASHRTAGWLQHMRGAPAARLEVLTTDDHPVRLPGLHVHRTKTLDDLDRTTVGGVPTTTVGRTLLDLGAVVPFETVELAAQDAILRGATSEVALLALLDRVGRRGRNGTAALRAVVAQSLPDEKLQSVLEHRLSALVAQSGLPTPELQHHVALPNGRDAFLDFAWPHAMTAAEADGRRWHATRKDYEAGLIRRRQLQQLGWDVRYYGWADVVEQAATVIDELRRLPRLRFAVSGVR